MSDSARIVVLGLGNLVRSDDGVGIHAIQRLKNDLRVPETVQVLDGGTLGLQLLPAIEDATHVLAIDAVNTGAGPGTVVRFDMSELTPLPGSPSVHQIGFADLLSALQWMGKFPEHMVLLGVQPEETGWGTQLSERIEAALPLLTQAAVEELKRWTREVPTNVPCYSGQNSDHTD
jgi:hydrogenase maturation protease